ncbi:hypothetical protein JOF56_007126 [Kibdelosporangium banguiense]|uniref:Secreted protein n=1 Tax=Kibdelosporangium banguiense TaxID=1365924 RepID=A0ABS4TS75_9PSEU|nr:hypothetical protein [Kibdelosporangium banguiense]MBP2326741.1 hypothetical protein [Kibdelosporangium banguiense]
MVMRKIALGLGATALAVGGMLAAGGAANAAPVSKAQDTSTGTVVSSSAGVLAALPGCASYDHSGRHAWVINRCSYTIHAKILWAFAPDTACYTLGPGGRLDSTRGFPARFDGAVSC